ncbi:hypothetical protein [Streptomyces spinosus]|uniref:hypothetical protein n=1 Tax=Streptomyces spinosus TaxID=2872623 RepID=UPI001CECA5AD|nr:hypothetical protein [Streptomyces spinosus]
MRGLRLQGPARREPARRVRRRARRQLGHNPAGTQLPSGGALFGQHARPQRPPFTARKSARLPAAREGRRVAATPREAEGLTAATRQGPDLPLTPRKRQPVHRLP